MATLVRGAFDGALHNRLIYRLRTQGWPENLVRWVESFMSNRSASITTDDFTSEDPPLVCGLPQGSPASSILFLLCMQPLFRLVPGINLGYADDMCLSQKLEQSQSVIECFKIAWTKSH